MSMSAELRERAAKELERAAIERLALNLRAYAYAMGAPETEHDEQVALDAARLIMPALEQYR